MSIIFDYFNFKKDANPPLRQSYNSLCHVVAVRILQQPQRRYLLTNFTVFCPNVSLQSL